MIRKTVVRAASVLAFSAVLAGCSSGPSESDVRRAVEHSLEVMNDEIVQMAGSSAAARIDKFRLTDFDLLGCEEAGESYSCDVEFSMDTPMMAVNDKATSIRVRKTDDGWRVIGGLQ